MLDDVANGLIQGFSHFLLWLARLCIGLTVFGLKLFIELANYNGYIDAPTVVVGWVMLRDIANMFFVVVLLVIAFGTILGIEQYEWKKGLGKLVFAAVFINFSKMICGLIIDIAHVFTITFLNAVSAAAGGNLINMFKLDQMMSMISGKSVDNYQNFPVELLGAAFLAFLFAVIAMFVIGAYTTMMTVRVVALWVLIVLSPLAFILQVIPNTEGYAREWWEKFSKEVIAAPVMVFFLWLAFATLGSGNIVQTLGMNIDSAEANAVVTQGTFNGNSLSITEISSWENMANFFIAIAFLAVGFSVVIRLGAVGAGLVGGALDLAKKAALFGAGYFVARAIVGAGAKGAIGGAKYVGNRIPFVGGAAMKEYGAGISSLYKQKGIKGVATLGKKSGWGGYEAATRRSEIAKNLEGGLWKAKEGEELGAFSKASSKTLGWISARFVETAGRADKRAESWRDASERAKEDMEESYSTSSSKAGQSKLDATVKLQQAKDLGQAKKDIKFANRQKELIEGGGRFKDRQKLVAEAQGDAEQAKADAGTAIQDTEKETKLYYKRAKVQQEDLESDREKEILIARERDNFLKDHRKDKAHMAVNEQSIRDKHNKEDLEKSSVADYSLAMEMIDNQNKEIAATKTALQGATDPGIRAKLEKILREQRQGLSLMTQANLSRHASFVESNISKVVGSLDASNDTSMAMDTASIRQQQARFLTSLIGEIVSPDNLNEGLRKFVDLHDGGPEQAQAALENIRKNAEVAAGQGSIGLAGLMRTEIVNGERQTRLTDLERDKEYISQRRTGALAGSKVTSLAGGFGASMDRVNGKTQIKSKDALEYFVKMISPVTSNQMTNIDEFTKGDLAAVFQNSDTGTLDEVKAQLTQAMKDKRAMVQMLEFAAERMSGDRQNEMKAYIKQLEAEYKLDRKADQGGAAGGNSGSG